MRVAASFEIEFLQYLDAEGRLVAELPREAPSPDEVLALFRQMLFLRTVGFSVATGLLFAFTAAGFGRRKLWITIPVGIVLCLAVWLIFAGLLQLSLPAGPLEALLG